MQMQGGAGLLLGQREMLAKLAAGATGYDLIVPGGMRWRR